MPPIKTLSKPAIILCALVVALLLQCVSSIPVYRTAKNVEKGELRHAGYVALGFDNYPYKADLFEGTIKAPSPSIIVFSELMEYGITNKFNVGMNWFLSTGEIGLMNNLHYQISSNSAPVLHTTGFYLGGTLSSFYPNDGYAIIFAPEYIADFQNRLFFSARYIHRYILNKPGISIGATTHYFPHHQSSFEAIGGYKLPNDNLVSLVIGYNHVVNWWQLWLGFTFAKIYK